MTIKDLAAQTGYAVGTVSRVLNNHPNVSEKARQAILEAVKESGFQLNVNAKQLKQTRMNSVLVIVKGTFNELFSQMVVNIQTSIARTPYPLHVDYLDEDGNEVQRALQLCREKKPMGILFLGGNSDHFRADFGQIDIPCVLVTNDASDLDFPNLSSVCTDDHQAARCAVNALLEQGHRQIVVIGGDRVSSEISRLRYEGCMDAFRSYDIAFDPDRDYQTARYSYQDGYDAANRLLESERKFTALFTSADVMAVGAIRAFRDRGLRVPEDVSVMGFDGLSIASFLMPRLSTVSQQVEQMARRSVAILIDCMENGSQARHEVVPFTLELKESIRKIEE